jgi:hypothetical protein
MALRAWGVRRIRRGDAPADVRDDILFAGSRLAFVSVAVSVLVDVFDTLTDELDMFLEHPLFWRLEHLRSTREHGTALKIPDALRLSWSLDNVAMALVLYSDGGRREELRRIGQRLITNHAELRTSNSELLARGWANTLDVDRYITETRDDGVAILVDQPRELVAALDEAGGARAARSLRVVDLMMKAIAIRDGTTSPAEARAVWRAVVAVLEDENAADAFHVYQPGDLVAAAAASIVRAAAEGQQLDDGELASAIQALLDGANHAPRVAEPKVMRVGVVRR